MGKSKKWSSANDEACPDTGIRDAFKTNMYMQVATLIKEKQFKLLTLLNINKNKDTCL
jgi:hypothetical protein